MKKKKWKGKKNQTVSSWRENTGINFSWMLALHAEYLQTNSSVFHLYICIGSNYSIHKYIRLIIFQHLLIWYVLCKWKSKFDIICDWYVDILCPWQQKQRAKLCQIYNVPHDEIRGVVLLMKADLISAGRKSWM